MNALEHMLPPSPPPPPAPSSAHITTGSNTVVFGWVLARKDLVDYAVYGLPLLPVKSTILYSLYFTG
jgi:hypothetical protein